MRVDTDHVQGGLIVYLHEEVDGSCTPASCNLCCLKPLTGFLLQVEPIMKQDKHRCSCFVHVSLQE